MRYFEFETEEFGSDKFYLNNVGVYCINPNYKAMDYLRAELPFLFDLRVKDWLKIKKSVSASYDYKRLEDKLEYHTMRILKRDLKNKVESPLVKYCKELYSHRLHKAKGNLLKAMIDYVKSFEKPTTNPSI